MKNAKYAKPVLWTFTTVKTILTNQIYVGDIVGAKTRQHFGQVTKRNQEEYIIVKDMHEAIINRSDFQTVAELLEQSTEIYKAQIGKPADIQNQKKYLQALYFAVIAKSL